MGALFSTSAIADSFTLAFKLPNFFRGILAEGAASAVFIPILNQSAAQKNTQQNFNFLFTVTVIASSAVTALGILCAPWLSRAFYHSAVFPAGTSASAITQHTSFLIIILFPYLIAIAVATLIAALLHTQGRFKVAAALPIVLNLAMIAGISIVMFQTPSEQTNLKTATFILSAAVLIGGGCQVLLMRVALRSSKLRLSFSLKSLTRARLRVMRRLSTPVTLSALLHHLQILLLDPIALSLGAGGVTALFFSNRLSEFPLALLVYPVLTAAFPDLSRYHSQNQLQDFETAFKKSLSLILLSTSFALCVGILTYKSIVSLVFGFGAFTAASIVLTAGCLFFHLLGLPFIALNRLFTQTLYARTRGRSVVIVAACSLCASIGSVLLLIQFQPTIPMVALGASCGALLTSIVFIVLMSRSPGTFSFPLTSHILRQVTRTVFCLSLPVISTYFLRQPIAFALDALSVTSSSVILQKLFETADIFVTAGFLGILTLLCLVLSGHAETLELIAKLRSGGKHKQS